MLNKISFLLGLVITRTQIVDYKCERFIVLASA